MTTIETVSKILLLILTVSGLLTACSSPTGGGGGGGNSHDNAVTEGGSLDGVWVQEADIAADPDNGNPAYHLTVTYTISGTGWLRKEIQHYAAGSGQSDTFDWDKGSLEYRASDSAVIMTTDKTVEDDTIASPSDGDWTDDTNHYTYAMRNIVGNGIWHSHAYLRTNGSGSTILGTWDILENSEMTESERERVTFSNDDTYTTYDYTVQNGAITGSPTTHPAAAYAWDAQASKLTIGGNQYDVAFYAKGKYININGSSLDYTKQ